MRPSPQLNAKLIPRPKRPYTFTQLITLSDGSTFLHRTTSPAPIHRSTKDTKNTPLWNPSSQKLLRIEEDEAGKLRRFRQRFGRGFDSGGDLRSGEEGGENEVVPEGLDAGGGKDGGEFASGGPGSGGGDTLMDLISGYGAEKEGTVEDEAPGGAVREEKRRSGKGKGGEK